MLDQLPATDQSLLNDFQRDFPLIPRPFARIAEQVGVSEDIVLKRLSVLKASGKITRVGATVRPNTAGASTLAALSVPEHQIEAVARIVNLEDGVNHSYLREDDWNLWFVVTAPDPEMLQASLDRIQSRAELPLLDLRLKRAFNIDLGFSLKTRDARPKDDRPTDLSVLSPGDRPILHALSQGLPLVSRPFAELSAQLFMDEKDLIARIEALCAARLITRMGVIVRHRSLGWSANAMVVWDLPEDRMEAAGAALAVLPGVTLCYQRYIVPGVWPYGLFSMIHARSRSEAGEVLAQAEALPELTDVPHKALFSTHCFKQVGAQIIAQPVEAA